MIYLYILEIILLLLQEELEIGWMFLLFLRF
nr:MAG TPA: hypothetical protein [Caudoviricetes sp.]DAW93564.1 MAG TPA: hypothetical protein [Bacteriophage sp.]